MVEFLRLLIDKSNILFSIIFYSITNYFDKYKTINLLNLLIKKRNVKTNGDVPEVRMELYTYEEVNLKY